MESSDRCPESIGEYGEFARTAPDVIAAAGHLPRGFVYVNDIFGNFLRYQRCLRNAGAGIGHAGGRLAMFRAMAFVEIDCSSMAAAIESTIALTSWMTREIFPISSISRPPSPTARRRSGP